MSQTMPPQFDPSGGDPKAQAKAAKAYAKATRPWFKKKRFIIPIVLIALVVIGAATGGGDTSGSKGGNVGKGSDKEEATSAKVGDTVELKGTRYTVNSANTASNIGGAYGESADGVFVVVDLTIENRKNESKTFLDNAAEILAGNGKKYSADTDAQIYADKPLIMEQMDPDNPKTGTLVFDLPASAVAGSKLELSDLFGGGTVSVDLGLH